MHCCFTTIACHLTIRNRRELVSWLSSPFWVNGSLQLASVCLSRLNTPWGLRRWKPCQNGRAEVYQAIPSNQMLDVFSALGLLFHDRVLMLAWKWVKCLVATYSMPALIWQVLLGEFEALKKKTKKKQPSLDFRKIMLWKSEGREGKNVCQFLQNANIIQPSTSLLLL